MCCDFWDGQNLAKLVNWVQSGEGNWRYWRWEWGFTHFKAPWWSEFGDHQWSLCHFWDSHQRYPNVQHDPTWSNLMSMEEVCTPGCLREPSPARLSRRSVIGQGVYQGRLGAGLCQGVLARVSTLELPLNHRSLHESPSLTTWKHQCTEKWRVCGESPKFALYLRPMDFRCLCTAQAEDAPDIPQVNKKHLHMNHLQIRLPSKSDNADSDTTTKNPLNINWKSENQLHLEAWLMQLRARPKAVGKTTVASNLQPFSASMAWDGHLRLTFRTHAFYRFGW